MCQQFAEKASKNSSTRGSVCFDWKERFIFSNQLREERVVISRFSGPGWPRVVTFRRLLVEFNRNVSNSVLSHVHRRLPCSTPGNWFCLSGSATVVSVVDFSTVGLPSTKWSGGFHDRCSLGTDECLAQILVKHCYWKKTFKCWTISRNKAINFALGILAS